MATATAKLTAAELEQIQHDEIDAIQAILADDFAILKQTAWKAVGPAPVVYEILLRPEEEELKPHVCAVLQVRLPKRYPLLPAQLTLRSQSQDSRTKGLSKIQLQSLGSLLTQKSAELVGSEMLWELVTSAATFLAQAGGPVLSLEEEQKRRAQEAEKAELERRAAERALKLEAETAKANLLAAQITAEADKKADAIRQERQKKRAAFAADGNDVLSPPSKADVKDSWLEAASGSSNIITFLDPIEDGGRTTSLVRVGPVIDRTSLCSRHLVESAHPDPSGTTHLTWILESWPITSPYYSSSSGKRKLEEVEMEAEKLRKMRDPSLVNVLASALTRTEEGWNMSVVTEKVPGTNLAVLLSLCDRLPWTKVKIYLLTLLTSLDVLHTHNLLHRHITAEAVVIETNQLTGDVARLGLIAYPRRLSDMNRADSLCPDSTAEDEEYGRAWIAPESQAQPTTYGRKRDIFELGRLACQMLLGTDVVRGDVEPTQILKNASFLPDHARLFLESMLESVPRKRPAASELFLRLQDICSFESTDLSANTGTGSHGKDEALSSHRSKNGKAMERDRTLLSLQSPKREKPVRGLPSPGGMTAPPGSFWSLRGAGTGGGLSRYELDFVEIAFLGKGAYGSVVKAQNRLDNRFYAIKRIRLSSSAENDERTMREITALSRLDHNHIVRYVTCWIQETTDSDARSSDLTATSDAMTASQSQQLHLGGAFQSNPMRNNFAAFEQEDFLSIGHDAFSKSTSYPSIRFADDGDDEDEESHQENGQRRAASSSSSSEESDSDDDSSSKAISRSRKSLSQSVSLENSAAGLSRTRWLYVQMEYVEGATLKEAIDAGMSADEAWSVFRQCLEALAHVTSLNIIHRDLKPSNILVLPSGHVKLADFGLATTHMGGEGGPHGTLDEPEDDAADLTSDIGTSLYISPEVLGGEKYNHKVDVYALGVVFFEMLASQRVYKTGMERLTLIRDLRSKRVKFPEKWPNDLPNQTRIIKWLLDHDPAKRPTPLELLKSDLLPPKLEDEYIEETLRLMSDPSSAYNHQLLEALFSRAEVDPVRDFTFETGAESDEDSRLIGVVFEHLRQLFQRHGAVELYAPLLLPPTGVYPSDRRPVQLLDKTGKPVYLPYDLTVPFARVAARSEQQRFKRYCLAPVYRESGVAGGQPRSVLEVDFDIVSPERTPAAEGEILLLLDEILDDVPQLQPERWLIKINHHEVFHLVMERVPVKHRTAVAHVMGGLGSKATAHSARLKLQRLGLTRSVVDDIEACNLSGDVKTVMSRLERLVSLDHRVRLSRAVQQIQDVIDTAHQFGVQRRFLFTPLLATNAALYSQSVFFELVRDGKKRDVLAAGGRYDALLKRFASPTLSKPAPHGVGVQIAIGKIALALARDSEVTKLMTKALDEERSFGRWTPRRCDVYILSAPGLLSTRIEICRELWASGISADLSYDDGSGAEVLTQSAIATCRSEGILLIVYVRSPRASSTLRIRHTLHAGEHEHDVSRHGLVPFLHDQIARQRAVDVALVAAGSGSHESAPPLLVGGGSGGASGTGPNLAVPPTSLIGSSGPTQQIVPPDVQLLLPDRTANTRRNDRSGPDRRSKPSSRSLLVEKCKRDVTKLAEDLSSGNVHVIAVELASSTLDRFAAAFSSYAPSSHRDHTSGGSGEDRERLVVDVVSTAEERSYLRQVLEEIRARDSRERIFLYSIREDRSVLLSR